MPSSRAEKFSRAEKALTAIGNSYDQALEALMRQDLARVDSLLLEVELRLESLQPQELDSEKEHALRTGVGERFGRLRSAMEKLRGELRGELRLAREALRAIKAMRRGDDGKGARLARSV